MLKQIELWTHHWLYMKLWAQVCSGREEKVLPLHQTGSTTIRFNFPSQKEDNRFPVPHRAGPQETCCDQTFMLWQTAG